MKMVVAVVRTTCLEETVKALEEAGVRGMTISQIRGVGHQVTLSKPYAIHERIEAIVPDELAEKAMNIILGHAKTGLPGDGLIAVLPVESLMKIRTCEKVDDNTCKIL
jgi:nitrogen regulatory protein P-II 1